MIKLSLIIPLHNEATDLRELMQIFITALRDNANDIKEILLMENGSEDETFHLCQQLEAEYPALVKAFSLSSPSYGKAIKSGILASTGDVCVIYECDVLDLGFLRESAAIFARGEADFVVASKRHPASMDRRPLKRRLLTFAFNAYLKAFFDFPGSDTHGLKSIAGNVAKRLCELSITDGEILQTELVLLAHKLGYRVIEVPIQLREKRPTPIKISRRFPQVLHIIRELKRSLKRFEDTTIE